MTVAPNLYVIGGFFLFVLVAVSVAGFLLLRRAASSEGPEAGVLAESSGEPEESLRATLIDLLHSLGEWMPLSEGSRRAMEQRLHFAGYRRPSAITAYFGLRAACGFVVAAVFGIAAVSTRDDGAMVFSAIVCGLGLGFLVPERVLDFVVSARNNRLRRSLPPALDLMVMGLEAGQGLDQSILTASRRLQVFAPDLATELAQLHLQTRGGASRQEAIQLMAQRNREPEIRKFCQLLQDADRFGSSLAPALRQHARFLRIRFRQRAQEQARKLSVKLVFPVFFLIFPAILVVTLGPAVLTMMRYFRGFQP